MTQQQLNRQVARVTGESVDFIRSRGFGMVIIPRRRSHPRGDGQAGSKQSKPVKPARHPLKAA